MKITLTIIHCHNTAIQHIANIRGFFWIKNTCKTIFCFLSQNILIWDQFPRFYYSLLKTWQPNTKKKTFQSNNLEVLSTNHHILLRKYVYVKTIHELSKIRDIFRDMYQCWTRGFNPGLSWKIREDGPPYILSYIIQMCIREIINTTEGNLVEIFVKFPSTFEKINTNKASFMEKKLTSMNGWYYWCCGWYLYWYTCTST